MVRNLLPRPQTLGRIAKHANKVDELADIFLDPMPPVPDAELFYQPGLDEATNPFAHKHPVEPRGNSKQTQVEGQTLEQQFQHGQKTDNRTKLRWPAAGQVPSHDPSGPGPNPSDPFADTPLSDFGDVPPTDTPPEDPPGESPETPPYEPDQFWNYEPWPDINCGQKDPITGITNRCPNASLSIRTKAKFRPKSKNGKTYRKSGNRYYPF